MRKEAERKERKAADRAVAVRRAKAEDDYRKRRELAFELNGTKIDVRRGFEFLKKAANAGQVIAMQSLALCYEKSWGVKNVVEAKRWYRKTLESVGGSDEITRRTTRTALRRLGE